MPNTQMNDSAVSMCVKMQAKIAFCKDIRVRQRRVRGATDRKISGKDIGLAVHVVQGALKSRC